MYVNPRHRLTDRDTLFALMASHPLGAWVCHGEAGLVANHVPFLLDRSRGPYGTLIGHVSRANKVWRDLGPASSSVVMFQGPQAYITPGWYPGKSEHGKVVPTWNYIAVHARGPVRLIDDRDSLLQIVSRLSDQHEASRPQPWAVSDAPDDYLDAMLRAIVGFALPIRRLEGKWKLGQNRSPADQAGVRQGLAASLDPRDQALAARMPITD